PVVPVSWACVESKARPAPKNHVRLRAIGPPTVNSYVGTVWLLFGSPNGLIVRQSSLLNVVRNDPLRPLPPDFVIAFTTPPVKRPYSAEMPDVATVVCSIASSINRSNGSPRRLS